MVSNSYMRNNSGEYGGGLSLYDVTVVVISNNIFSGNSADHGGGVYVNTDKYIHGYSVLIANTQFINNTARYGGGCYVQFTKYCFVVNSSFMNNFAVKEGGVIRIFKTN